jgi:hypothetical protein
MKKRQWNNLFLGGIEERTKKIDEEKKDFSSVT